MSEVCIQWFPDTRRPGVYLHQQKCTTHLMHQSCILTQVTSNLHSVHPGHPQSECSSWLRPVPNYHTLNLSKHPDRDRSHNTTPYPDTTQYSLLLPKHLLVRFNLLDIFPASKSLILRKRLILAKIGSG